MIWGQGLWFSSGTLANHAKCPGFKSQHCKAKYNPWSQLLFWKLNRLCAQGISVEQGPLWGKNNFMRIAELTASTREKKEDGRMEKERRGGERSRGGEAKR